MKTYYAPAERATPAELQKAIETAINNPVINELMNIVSGLLAVLNEQRQILAVNDCLLQTLVIKDVSQVLGLRPGEAVNCIHAHDMPGGCGTSEFCSTCGAVMAMVKSLELNSPVENTCAITIDKLGEKEDIYFLVRSSPLTFQGTRLLLFYFQNITNQQKWAQIERLFFHDINNIITPLLGASELLTYEANRETQDLAQIIYQLSLRLTGEVSMQKYLSTKKNIDYQPILQQVSVTQIFKNINDMFVNHPSAKHKLFTLPESLPNLSFNTDLSLLIRVINNMLINAFEASDEGDEVKVSLDLSSGNITFLIWNRQAIPPDIAKRIFQRNFSTKADIGRGLGTFSMKLFGEEFLGARVNFKTSESEGTVFSLSLDI
jgi:signal transduction histidine kinase